MKSLLTSFVLLFAAALFAGDCYENTIPGLPLGKGRVVGGAWKRIAGEHAKLTPAEEAAMLDARVDAENKAVLLRRARNAVSIGIGIIVAGFVFSAAIASYLPRKLADRIFFAGGGITLWGLIMAGMALSWKLLAFVAVFCALGYALHKLKPKGLFKPKPKEKCCGRTSRARQ